MSMKILKIKPSSTNATIRTFDNPHTVVFQSRSNYTGVPKKLLLWMPGSGGQPSNQMEIQKYAASAHGYFVVGIQYVNGDPIGFVCKNKPSSCEYDTRVEVITGQNTSPYVEVPFAEGILNRVTSLLNYLNTNVDPVWGTFFSSPSVIDWSLVTVAGHSQGGGNAVVMAQLYSVHMGTIFSAPADTSHWPSSTTFATPSSKVFGLIHFADQGCNDVLENWKGEGLTGPFYDFLKAKDNSGFGGSHTLCSSAPLSVFDCLTAHGSTAVDDNLILRSDGKPYVQPAWDYMFSGGSLSVGSGPDPTCTCHPCVVQMFVAIVGTLLAFLLLPIILAYAVRRSKQKQSQSWDIMKPLGIACIAFLSVSVAVVALSIVRSKLLSVSSAIGISAATSIFVTICLCLWWRHTNWWKCEYKSLSTSDDDNHSNSIQATI